MSLRNEMCNIIVKCIVLGNFSTIPVKNGCEDSLRHWWIERSLQEESEARSISTFIFVQLFKDWLYIFLKKSNLALASVMT